MSVWRDDIPYLKDGNPASAAVLNPPIAALASRTDYLKRELDGVTNKSNLLDYSVACDINVEIGDLVYYDSGKGRYDKALAVMAEDYAQNGQIEASERAYVKGLVIAKPTTTSADLLIYGVWTDANIVDKVIGHGAEKGLYYLSQTEPGKAVMEAPALRVPIITYAGEGVVTLTTSNLFQPNHQHRYQLLRGDWLSANDPSFDDMEKPSGAIKGYDVSSDPEFSEWFVTYPGQLAVFLDGKLQDPNTIITTRDNIWYMGEYGYGSSSSSSSSLSSLSSSSDSSFSSLSSSSQSSLSSSSPSSQSSSSSSNSSSSSESSSSESSPSSRSSSSDSSYSGSESWSSGSSSSDSSTSSSQSSASSASSESSLSSSSESSESSASSPSSSSESSESSWSSSSSWWDEWPDNAGSVVVYGYVPFLNGEPVVRAISTDTPCEIELKEDKGIVTISMKSWELVDQKSNGAYAVERVSDRTQRRIPVVSALTTSGGVVVKNRGDGVYDISTADVVEALLDAELINLNNVIELADDPYVWFDFPAGRDASLTARVAVPRLNPRNRYIAKVWAHIRGVIGAKPTSPVTFPEVAVELTHVKAPGSVAVGLPATPMVTTVLPKIEESNETMLYLGESVDGVEVSSQGMVHFKLGMPSDTYHKYLARFGIKLYLVEGDGEVVECGA